MVYQLKKSIFSLAILAALAACGGGGSDPAPAPVVADRPEGLYSGPLTNSSSSDFLMLVLENGELWSLYGTQTGATFSVGSFVQGTMSVSGNTFQALNLRDYVFPPPPGGIHHGTSAGTFNKAAGTITGDVVSNGVTVEFTGGPLAGSPYDYNAAPSLASFSGGPAWVLNSLDGDTITMTVSAGGAINATTASGCTFNGTATPRASGKNVFDVAVMFGGMPCLLANQSATGIAVAYDIGGGQTQLLVALQNAARTAGNAAFGVRP